jgi:hypothetical protein
MHEGGALLYCRPGFGSFTSMRMQAPAPHLHTCLQLHHLSAIGVAIAGVFAADMIDVLAPQNMSYGLILE